MEKQYDFKKCLNCQLEDRSFRRGYCRKCYPLILRIKKIEKGILPQVLERIRSDFDFFEVSKEEYIRQIRHRLEVIKEANSLTHVDEHTLEFKINETLRCLGSRDLGKFNDSIKHYLEDGLARSYVHQLFNRIQLLKPFKINYRRLYGVDTNKR